MDKRYFSEKLVEWYEIHKRDLPWRYTLDPYKIWLSEIILQQTRVNQGLPYFLRFIETFKDVFALASAPEQEVLRVWQGLGYYTRARNLHKCAKIIVADYNGVFPQNFSGLITLPGIGEYTAAAIASFCFRERVAVIDGNVFRVLARLTGEQTAINSPEGRRIFTKLANEIISESKPDLHNQAIMEFGAVWCTPQQPNCGECAFRKECVAANNDLQNVLPVKTKAKKSRKRYFNYFVLKKGKSLLMKRRESKDIWHGLFDFYLVETSKSEKPHKLIERDSFLRSRISEEKNFASMSYKHVLSHQTIISKFIVLDDEGAKTLNEPPLKYYSMDKIGDLPKPVLITRFLHDYNFL